MTQSLEASIDHGHLVPTLVLVRSNRKLEDQGRCAMAEAADSPEEWLRSLIYHFLKYLLDPARPNWKRRLMAREMANPTTALDELVEKNIRPLRDQFLLPTLRELTGGCFSRRQLPGHRSALHLAIPRPETDLKLNDQNGKNSNGRITTGSGLLCLVIPTNEELMIARETDRLVS